MTRSFSDDELCIVCLAATQNVGCASLRRLVAGARRQGLALADAIGLPAAELAAAFGLGHRAASAVAGANSVLTRGQAISSDLMAAGVRVVFDGEAGYPEDLTRGLGESAPMVLFLAGDPGVLNAPRIAVVGSRAPSRPARAAAEEFASRQAAAGTTVVSGGAKGIDTVGHRGALGSGATIVVPAMGVFRFRWEGIRAGALAPDRWCVLGQFPPQSEWQTPYALVRNRTIAALSAATVAFDPRDHGGTWRTCLATLAMRKPLFIVTGGSGSSLRSGLARLVRMGASALDPLRMPNADEFAQMVRDYVPPPQAAQLPLFPPAWQR